MFGFGKEEKRDFNEGLQEFHACENALLIDVREEGEYAQGHVDHAVNWPLSRMDEIGALETDLTRPIFLYCLSGGRSARAEAILRGMGYRSVKNIGGIQDYHGGSENEKD